MSDYIKREEVLNAIHELTMYRGTIPFDSVIFNINKIPTADVRENVREEWVRWYEGIEHDGYTEYILHYKCPKCGTEYGSHTVKFINFCPFCGADMRGKQNE